MGAEFLLVVQELRLLELAHQRAQLQQRSKVAPIPVQVTLRYCMLGEGWLRTQIEHQVKALAHLLRFAAEIDRTGCRANLDASPVRMA